MADVFNRRPLTLGNSFAADSAVITFTGAGLAPGNGNGLLVQNLGFQYTQPVSRIYELGTQLTYYIAGRPQGQGSMGRVLGPGTMVLAFYTAFGDVCKAKGNIINVFVASSCGDPCASTSTNSVLAAANTGPVQGVRWCISGVVLTNLGMTIAAQDMILNEGLGFMFTSLEVCNTAQAQPCWPAGTCCS